MENNTSMQILISDLHETPFRDVKFESQKYGLGEAAIQQAAKRNKSKQVLWEAKKLIAANRIPFVISGGDFMEAECTERGWQTEDDVAEARKALSCASSFLGAEIIENIGNHETGYELPLTTDPEAGISLQSISNTLKTLGRESLYHSLVHKGFRFCFLPYLFMEKRGVDFDIEKLKTELVRMFERDLEKPEPTILFLHDPDSLCYEPLLEIVREHKENGKIKLIFCGHFHARETLGFFNLLVKCFNGPWWIQWLSGLISIITWKAFSLDIAKRVQKYFVERRQLPAILKELGVTIIPAPGGMMGIGGGFLVLNMETLKVKKYS